MYFLNEVHIDGLRVDGTAWIRRTGADLGGGDVQDNPDGWSWLQYLNNSVDDARRKLLWPKTATTTGPSAANLTGWSRLTASGIRTSTGPFAAIEAANDNDRNMWAIRDAVNFAYNGNPIQRVLYTENHDEVANGRSRPQKPSGQATRAVTSHGSDPRARRSLGHDGSRRAHDFPGARVLGR